MPAIAEPRPMAKKKAPKVDSRKTLKCGEKTHRNVSLAAKLRGVDIADYVDQFLGPFAEKDAKDLARKIADA